MDFNINGKNALITGSSKGIGKTIAKYLENEGCKVMLNGRNLDHLNNIKSEFKEPYLAKGDVSKEKDAKDIIKKFISKLSSLDILVCNVGDGKYSPPGKETHEEWQKVMSQNLFSATNIISEASDYLSLTNGVIVCISSICGIETIKGAPITYSAAKAALNSYVKGISLPFAEKGIRINAIAPGNILFPGSTWDKKIKNSPERIKGLIKEIVPMQRFGTPEEIANLVCFLASPLSGFITGTIVQIDGGQLHT